MAGAPDARIDDYIAALPAWQQEICRTVRRVAHEADPDVEETIKRTRQPHFVLHGNVCALLATRDHVDVFLYDGGLAPDPHGIITGGHGNATGRTIAVYEDHPVAEDALREIFRAVIADNRAGGWRSITKHANPGR
ncbi:hypothetical protein IWX63_001118 [Arthrobacter sp. CAN_A2]|uniref:DUF1801 domain-containing protein n=1 Tax=Arthrobacter sp. CAN_A2 TaxID=2787718 RepID=UPI0018EFFF94